MRGRVGRAHDHLGSVSHSELGTRDGPELLPSAAVTYAVTGRASLDHQACHAPCHGRRVGSSARRPRTGRKMGVWAAERHPAPPPLPRHSARRRPPVASPACPRREPRRDRHRLPEGGRFPTASRWRGPRSRHRARTRRPPCPAHLGLSRRDVEQTAPARRRTDFGGSLLPATAHPRTEKCASSRSPCPTGRRFCGRKRSSRHHAYVRR